MWLAAWVCEVAHCNPCSTRVSCAGLIGSTDTLGGTTISGTDEYYDDSVEPSGYPSASNCSTIFTVGDASNQSSPSIQIQINTFSPNYPYIDTTWKYFINYDGVRVLTETGTIPAGNDSFVYLALTNPAWVKNAGGHWTWPYTGTHDGNLTPTVHHEIDFTPSGFPIAAYPFTEVLFNYPL